MTVRTILVPASNRLSLVKPLESALSLARPLGAHIDVVYLSPPPRIITAQAPEGSSISTLDVEELRRRSQEAADRAQSVFQDWCVQNSIKHQPKDHLLGSTFARWRMEETELGAGVARWGRLADIVVINRPAAFDVQASQCFDAAVFEAGRPTLIASSAPEGNPLRHVLIAWNGSLEATHAVGLSVDLLDAAERVSIFSARNKFDETSEASDLAAALRWHGIEAACLNDRGRDHSTGEALLYAAEKHEASLIIMGAFTHSRIRETLLGGVTRHILKETSLPVIMAH